MEDKNLRKLPIDYLWDGLILNDDIYNHSGEVMLLPKGEVVVKSKLEKLIQFYGEEKSVMVHESTYLEITADERVLTEMSREEIEKQTGYEMLHQNIGLLFRNSNTQLWLNKEKMESISQEIADKLTELDIVTIFGCMDDPRPPEEQLQRHSLNVAFLNGIQARWLDMEPEEVKKFILAGLLHDIGMTMIPEEILNEPHKLTENETEVMQMHPIYSDRLLINQFDDEIRSAARHHHEKLDGNGYPDGIAEEDISLYARVTAISDIYDTEVAAICNKGSKLPLDVLNILYQEASGGLDKRLVMDFIKNMRLKYTGRHVFMSDGRRGIIRYIPFNDTGRPVVQQGAEIRQTDEGWFCKSGLAGYGG